MPLPAALAAKLAKRGIYTQLKASKNDIGCPVKGYEGCPNKYNVYHECEKYCSIRWKLGQIEPDFKYLKLKEKMLRKYPLPYNWREVYDRGCRRFYYWDIERDLVSWYPPKHSKAIIGRSAAKIREERIQIRNEKEKREKDRREQREQEEKDHRRDRSRKHEHRKHDHKKSRGEDALDPMDPAAYSDIPRGTWSSGLEARGDAKTGADITVSGPLYQSRPYPSPGAILAANKKQNR